MNKRNQEGLDEASKADSQDKDDIVFEAEANNLQDNKWFKPDTGTTKLKFLDNGTKEKRTYDGEEKTVGVFTVKVAGEELQWSVTKGTSETSLWGQLMKLGAARGGLEGEEITLIRSGEGNDTTYTVQEAADL